MKSKWKIWINRFIVTEMEFTRYTAINFFLGGWEVKKKLVGKKFSWKFPRTQLQETIKNLWLKPSILRVIKWLIDLWLY